MDPLRFGPLSDPRSRWVAEGVVSGISGYGNSVGVPTVGGEVVFDPCYQGNPLVNVLCLGLLPVDRLVLGQASGEGNLAVLLGSATGRDGIGAVNATSRIGPRLGLAGVIVAAGCGPSAAPRPVVTSLPAAGAPPCAAAGARYDAYLAGWAAAMTGDGRAAAEARTGALAGVTARRCTEDGWPDAVATCLAGAGADEPQRQCLLRLHAHQYRRWFLQLANGQPPAAAGDDDQRGPSCLQVADRYAQVIGVPSRADAPPPPPADPPVELARRWIPQILLERCLVDSWAEPPRACFGGADAELATCARLLPEAAARALQDHLHDMTESLGVP